MDDERLAALIRAGFEAEVLDVRLPEDLADRVIARHGPAEERPAPRRGIGRVHFFVAAGALAATAAVLAVPMLLLGSAGQGGSGPGTPGRHVVLATPTVQAYDPVPQLVLGPLPKGWRMAPGGFTETTTKNDTRYHQRSWSADFLPRSPDRRRMRLQVMTGRVTLTEARETVTGLGRTGLSPVRVPAGVAELAAVAGADQRVVVVWQPRTGIVVSLVSTGLSQAKVLGFVRGTALRG